MRLTRRSLFLLAGGTALAPLSYAIAQSRIAPASTAKPASKFTVYDSLTYAKRPSLNLQAVSVNGGQYWSDDRRIEPSEAACRDYARVVAKGTKRLVIDIEHWAIDIRHASKTEVKDTIRKTIQIVDWMKNEVPTLAIGIYPFPPITDYWTPAAKVFGMGAWQEANEFLRPIAERVDFLAPEIYTYYDDRDGWLRFATASLAQSLRYGRPVTPIVWPRYHNGNDKLKYQLVPGDFWRLQLKTVRESGVNGLILWDWEPEKTLDPNWGWWQETVQFVKAQSA